MDTNNNVVQLRLLRIFKLAKTWKTMRMLLSVIMKTLFSVINVTIVLAILLYVCAVMGYQLFAGTYNTRWVINCMSVSLHIDFGKYSTR